MKTIDGWTAAGILVVAAVVYYGTKPRTSYLFLDGETIKGDGGLRDSSTVANVAGKPITDLLE